MAGFFGLFNYEKEGPGVSKDAPKKRGIFLFFEFFFRNFWKLVTNNMVYSLISLPILTNGLAEVGITNVARNIARDKHSFGLSDFFDTIKKNWKQGLIVGIINILLYALLIFDLWFFWTAVKGSFSTVAVAATLFMLFVLTCMNYYMWTLIITFNFSIKQIFVNSFKFVIINLKMNLFCMLCQILVIGFYVGILFLMGTYWTIALSIEIMILVCTYPAFRALLIQFCTFPCIKKCIIDPYYAQHPNEDIEKRRDLGLEVEEEPQSEPDDDTTFDD